MSFDKFEIFIIIFVLLVTFYVVISLGAGRNKDKSEKIKSYMRSVRILITIIGVVSLILFLFL